MITIENHELYAIDYIEGELDTPTREAFEAFLRDHPALREELKELAGTRLLPRQVTFEGKEALKRFDEERRDYLVIAAAEGVLTDEERERVGKLPDKAAFEESAAAYARIRMMPDRSIRFPGKGRLKRRAAPGIRWLVAGTAAAAILFGILRATDEVTPEVTPRVVKTIALAKGEKMSVRVTPTTRGALPVERKVVVPPATVELPGEERVEVPVIVIPREHVPGRVTAEILPRVSPGRLYPRALLPSPAEREISLAAFPVDMLLKDNLIASLLHTGQEFVEQLEKRLVASLVTTGKDSDRVTY